MSREDTTNEPSADETESDGSVRLKIGRRGLLSLIATVGAASAGVLQSGETSEPATQTTPRPESFGYGGPVTSTTTTPTETARPSTSTGTPRPFPLRGGQAAS